MIKKLSFKIIFKQIKNSLLLKELLALGLISIFSNFFISFILFIITQNSFPHLLEIWNRWDTPHYTDIAQNGYQNFGESRFFIVFFPFYPLLIKFFHFIFSNYLLSALIVSNIAYIIALIFFYKLVLIDYQKKIALRTIFYFTIFPTAYFLHAGYPESLFLAVSIASFYFARKEKWFLSGILGMLASLTKINGIILFPALFVEYLHQKKFKIKGIKINIL